MRQRASSSSLPHLGMNSTLPFVGRDKERTAIWSAWSNRHVVVLRGTAGAGKTRLAQSLIADPPTVHEWRTATIHCYPGDRASAVRARAERKLGLLPGTLEHTNVDDWLLIIDDIHNLSEYEARALALMALSDNRRGGRWLLITRDALPVRTSNGWISIDVHGLDEQSARELWHHLEDAYGPTGQGACDSALQYTRAIPFDLCREYACAVFGHNVWNFKTMPPHMYDMLAALSVLRVPITPAGINAMTAVRSDDRRGDASTVQRRASALFDLVSRQLVEPVENGGYRVHHQIREQVLAQLQGAERKRLMAAAADMLTQGIASIQPRDSFSSIDHVAPTLFQPVERLREAAYCSLGSGDTERAFRLIAQGQETALGRGAYDELEGLLHDITSSASPADAQEISRMRARTAARHGRVAEALELCSELDDGFDPVEAALLNYRSGDVTTARRQLRLLSAGDDPEERCLAAAALAEIELICNQSEEAEHLVASAFQRDRSSVGDTVRARLHMALAAIEEHAGRISSARASLSRAAGSGTLEPSLSALIESRRSMCLLHEGRSNEALTAIDSAERIALDVDAISVADEIRRIRCLVALYRGDTQHATVILQELVSKLRRRGDEMGALRAEIDLTRAHVERGALTTAAELVSACTTSAARRKLSGMSAELQLIAATLDMEELRLSSARIEVERVLATPSIRADVRVEAAALFAVIHAWEQRELADTDIGRSAERTLANGSELRNPLDDIWTEALVAHAREDIGDTLRLSKKVAAQAERAGRRALMVDALCMTARLASARRDIATAIAAASRAVREAAPRGLQRAHAHALLVLAALAQENSDTQQAIDYASQASDLATQAGLPISRLVAAEALESINGTEGVSDASGIRHAARATMSAKALDTAARVLNDLGLTAVRPFRLVSAGGSHTFVADTDPERLRLAERSLAIDSIREIIVRDGETIADLRRRSLLKRLLFLFASSPGRIFSKEEIVETVWQVAYHPLRHDAALFTNIMRIRRLLGKDGADLVRVCEDGYRFLPPKDYLYIEAVDEHRS